MDFLLEIPFFFSVTFQVSSVEECSDSDSLTNFDLDDLIEALYEDLATDGSLKSWSDFVTFKELSCSLLLALDKLDMEDFKLLSESEESL
ncbi:hypothetical protein GDO86_002728 [Hymenochirus boettgeri]|uniref:Uncharacterized protein n=1 Tax=Hymenochirus boettgeri TaxID=247094 RepID=A0A8T2K481_9PIPI|nr:hypothetical protein GDO86_002728 [Hymenochirus boettgeri]